MKYTHWLADYIDWDDEFYPNDDFFLVCGEYDGWELTLRFAASAGYLNRVSVTHESGASATFAIGYDANTRDPDVFLGYLEEYLQYNYPDTAPVSPAEKERVLRSMEEALEEKSVEAPAIKPASSPPCDAPEDSQTVREVVLTSWWLPLPVKQLVWERLDIGEQKYNTPLRTPWDKALEYLREEEGDMVAYLLAGGYTYWAALYGWLIFLRMLWMENPRKPLNGGLE